MRDEPRIFYWHRLLHFSNHRRLASNITLLALGIWFGYLLAEAAT